jgi:hypothetical protein
LNELFKPWELNQEIKGNMGVHYHVLLIEAMPKKLARSNNIINTKLKLNALLFAVRKEHLNSTEVSKSESR